MVKVKRNLITKIKKNFNRIKIKKIKIHPPCPVVRYIKIMIHMNGDSKAAGIFF